MFRGAFEKAIDAKGRTGVPERFRDVLAANHDDRLIITTGLDPCLHAHPVRQWVELKASLGKRGADEPGIQQLMRLYVDRAQECVFDGQGRVIIPQALRDHAGLQQEVVWVGLARVIELWSGSGWAKAHAEAKARVKSG